MPDRSGFARRRALKRVRTTGITPRRRIWLRTLEKYSTRISIARVVGECVVPDGLDEHAGFIEYRNVCELRDFVVSGPIAVVGITARASARASTV
jgi:hypothetical protein